jgi:hypothetical protein
MRNALLILGVLALFLLVAVPWFSIYDWVQRERRKRYKSREDVV